MKEFGLKILTVMLLFGFIASPAIAQAIGVQSEEADKTFLQVAHLAPFAEDASVTITLNGVPALTGFGYGDSTEYIGLEPGDYDVAVIPTGAEDPAIEVTVTLAVDTFYTVIAVGDGVNQDLALILEVDDLTEPAPGKFHLRLGHLAPFAAGNATADVRLANGDPVQEGVNFGDVTAFIPLDAGTYDLIITTPGGGTTLIDPIPVDFAEGAIVSAFATGEDNNQPLGVFALPSGQEGSFIPLGFANLQVAHLAPFAEDASVTITLNGEPALTEFGYGDSTAYIELPAGEYTVAVFPTPAVDASIAELVDPAIEATVQLEVDVNYTVMAVGDGVNQDLDLILLEDDLTEPAAGKFHLRLGHLAPFAEGDATADVRLKDGTPVLEGVKFGEVTEFLPLDSGEYDLIITTPGGETTLIDPISVDFAEGAIVSAFATGEGVNQPLGIFALPAGEAGDFVPLTEVFVYFFPIFKNESQIEPEVSYLQVAHLAPFAEDASVTITLNGAEALTEFGYGDSTVYIELEPGDYDVAIIPTGAEGPAIEATVTLAVDTYYTVIAVGDGVNQDLALILEEDDLTEPEAGKFHLRLGHLAPFAEGEATADVRLADGTPVLEGVNFGDVTEFLPLDAGEYDLIITTPGGDTTLIDPIPLDFAAGTIISAFATGEGTNQALGVFGIQPGVVGEFIPLSEYAFLQVAHLAPFAEDASVTITLNGAEALTEFGYGDSTVYIELEPGEYDVAVIPTGAEDPAIEATVTLEADVYYTVIAVGDGVNQDLALILEVDDLTEPEEGKFQLRLGHLAPFAEGDATADIRLADGTPVLEGVNFSDVTAFIPLDAGEYDLIITTPGGDTTLIDPIAVDFEAGTIISAFATGEGVNQPLNVFALQPGVVGDFLPLK